MMTAHPPTRLALEWTRSTPWAYVAHIKDGFRLHVEMPRRLTARRMRGAKPWTVDRLVRGRRSETFETWEEAAQRCEEMLAVRCHEALHALEGGRDDMRDTSRDHWCPCGCDPGHHGQPDPHGPSLRACDFAPGCGCPFGLL